ncbi:MAG: zinc ABC transporter substrate-binding protein [Bacilli bacterium]|nr:zinc ABC transporter substrate-binding protein [Bacilli bacterium]
MKKVIKCLSIIFIIFLFSGCKNKDSMEDITIYTSLYPIDYVVETLYGNYANIISIYPSDVNPYEYKLTSKQIKNYSSSDLIIYNGLDIEKDYIVEMLNKNKKLKIIDSTAKIEYTNSMDEIWINPSNMLTIAQNTRNGLKEYINSSYLKKEIDKNYDNLKLQLSSIDAQLKESVENAKNKNIIVASNDLKVLSKYGLNIISIDEETVSDKDLADAKSLIVNKEVNYIFVKKGYHETQLLKDLKDTYNIKYLEIDTLNNISVAEKNDNKDYITIMNENIDKLKEELY